MTLQFPRADWHRLDAPESVGWRSAALQAAEDFARGSASAAGMIVHGGRLLWQWGDLARRVNVHSIRKSLLNALFGISVQNGEVDLSASLRDLGIDDIEPRLSNAEKAATLLDLLRSRSGVFHPAVYETPEMKAARPARGSHAAGSCWYYNNWDFNVLGTVYERLTGRRIFEDFAARVGLPIGMQDFRAADGTYVQGPESSFPAYPVRLSTRDMARFGLLYLARGDWSGRCVIPSDWVVRSVSAHSAGSIEGAYGLLWWTERDGAFLGGEGFPPGSFAALGTRGNGIVVIPVLDLVVVNTIDTDLPNSRMSWPEVGRLVRLVMRAGS
jgi:CubicO group peptidase (beta-lactamase class C family)